MKPVFALAALLFVAQAALPARMFADDMNADKMGEMRERRMEHLTRQLTLTPDQQKSVKSILDAKFEKMKALQEDSENQINAVLNDDQKTKYAAMKKNMQEHRQEHREQLKEKHSETKDKK